MSAPQSTPAEPDPKLDEFPDRPAVSAECWPIYLSPVPSSDERLIVGMVGITQAGEIASWPCLTKAAANCAFGIQPAQQLLAWTEEALREAVMHLATGARLESWAPHFSGMAAGRAVEMQGDTLELALMSAAELIGASFARRALDQARDAILIEQEAIEDPVQKTVREQVLKLRPAWSKSFYYKHKPTPDSRPVTIYFADGQYACNLTRVLPEKIGYYEQRFKIALYDILAYRDTSAIAPKDTELLVRIPRKSSMPADAWGEISRLLDQFDAVADKERLRVHRLSSDQDAVRRILRMDA